MKDAIFFGAIVLTFALAITLHVVLSISVARRTKLWRGLVAFVVPPLAPYWGFTLGMRGRAIAWIVSVVLYAVSVLVQPR